MQVHYYRRKKSNATYNAVLIIRLFHVDMEAHLLLLLSRLSLLHRLTLVPLLTMRTNLRTLMTCSKKLWDIHVPCMWTAHCLHIAMAMMQGISLSLSLTPSRT